MLDLSTPLCYAHFATHALRNVNMPVIRVSIPDPSLKLAQQTAQMIGVSLSEYIRMLVIRDIRDNPPEPQLITTGVTTDG